MMRVVIHTVRGESSIECKNREEANKILDEHYEGFVNEMSAANRNEWVCTLRGKDTMSLICSLGARVYKIEEVEDGEVHMELTDDELGMIQSALYEVMDCDDEGIYPLYKKVEAEVNRRGINE